MNSNLALLIKQNQAFKDEYTKAIVGLIYVSNQVHDMHQQLFKQHGITSQQYNVLRILRGQFPKSANINLIKDRMLDKMCDASRIVERLLKLNLVTREVNPIDKRHSDVTITENALDILKIIDAQEANTIHLLHALDETEIFKFNELINKVLQPLVVQK